MHLAGNKPAKIPRMHSMPKRDPKRGFLQKSSWVVGENVVIITIRSTPHNDRVIKNLTMKF